MLEVVHACAGGRSREKLCMFKDDAREWTPDSHSTVQYSVLVRYLGTSGAAT